MFIMLFSIEQSILAEETLANLWSFAKSANVSTLQSFPPYGSYVSCNIYRVVQNFFDTEIFEFLFINFNFQELVT